MPTLNELKYQKLFLAAGKAAPATLNELELFYLGTKLGEFVGTLNERWFKEFLTDSGGTAKAALPWNENAILYLTFKGQATGTLNERWYGFWESF